MTSNHLIDERREAFEVWAISQGHTIPDSINGNYCDVQVTEHWKTWQAACDYVLEKWHAECPL